MSSLSPIILLNPYSNRWNAQKCIPTIKDALKKLGLECEVIVTNAPGHATQLARKAVTDGFSPIIAAGGDGTIGEVINGMVLANPKADGSIGPLGIIPIGTANDLGDQMNIPRDIYQAIEVIEKGNTRLIDLGKVNDRYFVNNAGLGLEPYITILQSRMKRLQGNPRYIAAALKGIMHHPSWQVHLEWEGGHYSGPVSLISIGNCPRTGGVFYTVPHANPSDGKLSFIYGYISTRLKTLLALPMTMKPGKGNITEHPAVHEATTSWLKVRSETPTPAHADGEIFTQGIQELEFQVFPGKLEVIVP
jgi:diacylglycerol kinase (ATP)